MNLYAIASIVAGISIFVMLMLLKYSDYEKPSSGDKTDSIFFKLSLAVSGILGFGALFVLIIFPEIKKRMSKGSGAMPDSIQFPDTNQSA